MRRLASALIWLSLTACAARQVQVESGTTPAVQATLQFTNNDTQPVNVYVQSGGSDLFLKQVAANTTESLPVRGISVGSSVRLRAARADGTRAYTKDGVTISTTMTWVVP